jgi:hypothetical protein
MEERLDRLISQINCGGDFLESFRAAYRLAAAHYSAEESLISEIARMQPAVAQKLRAQHAEALEMAAGVEEAVSAGQTADALRLVKRFHAIAQHNIIEEERDVFPLLEG